jgi:hypothetical protein
VWHASVAVIDMEKRRTMTIEELGESTKRVAAKVAKELLGGVGQIPSSLEQQQVALHYRRALTEEEYAALPQSWCAIPPVHEAGRGLILEENT